MTNHSIGIIGGADGPTAIFVATSPGWINFFGLIIVVLMLIPNIIYAIRHRGEKNRCTSKAMNILEQIGRYGCILLMVFNIGLKEFGFSSAPGLLVYLLGNGLLLLSYWVCWAVYFKKPRGSVAMAMAVIPTGIFLLSGICLRHWLLVTASMLFGAAHIYVTNANNK